MTMWGAGREPAQPSDFPEPVGPASSGPTSSPYPPVGSVPMGPVYPSAVGSALIAPVSSGLTGAVYPPPVVVRHPRWVVPALVVMGVVTLAALTVASWALAGGGTASDAGTASDDAGASAGPTLQEAHQACGSRGDLSDGGRTLYLDMKGEDFGSGTLTWSQVQCYLTALQAPEYVLRHMQSTRALDGRQSDTWGNFDASWTYHPDHGLDVLIRQTT
ncbi:MAG: hypothetical protein IRY85_18345 [Micromonosporaceae bacterium]|nr:hypothetical protein [Micromonosporaceae bacterium]